MRLDKNDSLRFAKRRVFGLNRQALKSAGAIMESVTALEQNHRSTDIKSAGAWMNNTPGSGAKSSHHRHKVGGAADE
jgi:hypothetical protein